MPALSLTATTTYLLEALQLPRTDPNSDAMWSQFDRAYRPIVISFARRAGLSEHDAAEVAQETLYEFVRDYRAGKYSRSRGRLRSWIFGIAHHRTIDLQRRHARNRVRRGVSAIVDFADPASASLAWESECRRSILHEALAELRVSSRTDPKTLRIFQLVALEDKPPAAVAAECGVTVAEVYRVKNRVARRLRDIVSRLTNSDDGSLS